MRVIIKEAIRDVIFHIYYGEITKEYSYFNGKYEDLFVGELDLPKLKVGQEIYIKDYDDYFKIIGK